MKLATVMIAGAVGLCILGPAAHAQGTGQTTGQGTGQAAQQQTPAAPSGTVTRVDRMSGTISIQQTPSGTVGTGSGGATEEFKVQDGAMLNAVHAGDRVTFPVSQAGGTKTLTKLDRQ